MPRPVQYEELSQHNTTKSAWMSLHGQVWDLTPFLRHHPGGEAILLKYAGKDGTRPFSAVHPKDMVKLLPEGSLVGTLEVASVPQSVSEAAEEEAKREEADARARKPAKPPIDRILNVFDMAKVASSQCSPEAWDYLMSAADDELTLRENHLAFHRLWIKPRVLRDVSNVQMGRTVLGARLDFPLYVSATALGKLYHPEGELPITRACATMGVPQMCPTLASCTLEEMAGCRAAKQTQWYQVYFNHDRKVTEQIVRRAESLGMQALFVTVDTNQFGNRERDKRNKPTQHADLHRGAGNSPGSHGVAESLNSFLCHSLNWEDIKWLKSITKVPIVLKGIQCAADALLAWKHGLEGIVISNHGGRQLEFARPAPEVLLEVVAALRSVDGVKRAGGPEDGLTIFVDGGIRRGTDVLKCLALGAHAVGIGRPVVFGLAGYGQTGVERVLQLFRSELERAMMLSGMRSLEEINSELLELRSIGVHGGSPPVPHLFHDTYAAPVFAKVDSKL